MFFYLFLKLSETAVVKCFGLIFATVALSPKQMTSSNTLGDSVKKKSHPGSSVRPIVVQFFFSFL